MAQDSIPMGLITAGQLHIRLNGSANIVKDDTVAILCTERGTGYPVPRRVAITSSLFCQWMIQASIFLNLVRMNIVTFLSKSPYQRA